MSLTWFLCSSFINPHRLLVRSQHISQVQTQRSVEQLLNHVLSWFNEEKHLVPRIPCQCVFPAWLLVTVCNAQLAWQVLCLILFKTSPCFPHQYFVACNSISWFSTFFCLPSSCRWYFSLAVLLSIRTEHLTPQMCDL